MPVLLGSVVRHLLTAVAGALVGVGVAEPAAADFTQAAEPVVGGLILYAVGQIWSIFDKKR
jgi:hypothetical protein